MRELFAAQPVIVVDGVRFDDELDGYVEQVVVDEHVELPQMFAVTLHDPQRDVIDRSGMRIGAEVEIAVAGQGADEAEVALVKGDLVAVECDYDELGARVVARGYATSHRLHRGRRTRTFINVTDGDIVERVAREAGVEVGAVQSPETVYEHVTQPNVSDWQFLAARARAIGYELAVVDGRLEFGRPSRSEEAPTPLEAEVDTARDPRQLTFGENLLSFHGRISAAEQVKKVEARGWSVERKEAFVATAPAGTVAAQLELADPETLAGFFGDPEFVSADRPLDENEAEAVARALAERIGSGFAEADGVAVGHASLRAGTPVAVTEVGEDFSGKYVLTHTRHVFDRDGYRTHFTISGRHDRSLLGLVSAAPGHANGSNGSGVAQIDGLVRGIVDENFDPLELGRVRIRLPWLNDDFTSAWAPVMQLGAGPRSGTFFLPAVGDEVLVGFEHADIDRPIVVGGLFNGRDEPPVHSQLLDNGRVTGRGVFSRKGHRILLHDANDISGITLSTVDGDVSIGINAIEQKLVLHSQGSIEISALGDVVIQGAKIKLN
ncbi:VgrG-related protein [soil metagenome]